MLQNTKALHIPSSGVKTGTTQKQNLSLAGSQAQQLLQHQEQTQKGGKAWAAPKVLFLWPRMCSGLTERSKELWFNEGSAWSLPSWKGILIPIASLCRVVWALGLLPKNERFWICYFSHFPSHPVLSSCPEKSSFFCPPGSLLWSMASWRRVIIATEICAVHSVLSSNPGWRKYRHALIYSLQMSSP